MLWGVDQQAAYRQLPVDVPAHTWVLLFTGAGPTPRRHRCLMFGAIGSIWAYARTADCMVYLNRAINLSPSLHYVDDFGTIETQLFEKSYWPRIAWKCG